MEVTNRRLFLIALILGVITTIFVYLYLSRVETVSQTIDPTKKVVVAKVTLQPKTVITEEMIQLKEMKVSNLLESTYTDSQELIGKVAKETIYAGEPVVHQRLVDEQYEKQNLAYSVPKGFRAITLKNNTVIGVGGFIQPGDHVDVIGTYDPQILAGSPPGRDYSKIVLQDIVVLAVGSKVTETQEEGTNRMDTVTLAVKPHDAEKLTFTEERGSIRLLLRPINEKDQPGTGGITSQNIFTP